MIFLFWIFRVLLSGFAKASTAKSAFEIILIKLKWSSTCNQCYICAIKQNFSVQLCADVNIWYIKRRKVLYDVIRPLWQPGCHRELLVFSVYFYSLTLFAVFLSIRLVSVSKHLSQPDLCVTPGGHAVLKYSLWIHRKRLSAQTPSPEKTFWENEVALSVTSSPLWSFTFTLKRLEEEKRQEYSKRLRGVMRRRRSHDAVLWWSTFTLTAVKCFISLIQHQVLMNTHQSLFVVVSAVAMETITYEI